MDKNDARLKNLIPINERSEEERKAILEKSHNTRKLNAEKRRTIKEIAEKILKLNGSGLTSCLDNEELKKQAESLNLSLYDVTYLKMIDETLKGNVKAFEHVRDSAGDKPTTKTETDVNIITQTDNRLIEKIAQRMGISTDDIIDGEYKEI